MDAATGLLASVAYLDRWSWRTWALLQSYVERCKNLEVQVASLQEEVRSLKRQVELPDWREVVENESSTRRNTID